MPAAAYLSCFDKGQQMHEEGFAVMVKDEVGRVTCWAEVEQQLLIPFNGIAQHSTRWPSAAQNS